MAEIMVTTDTVYTLKLSRAEVVALKNALYGGSTGDRIADHLWSVLFTVLTHG